MSDLLQKPSLSGIRTHFIQDGLRQHPDWDAVAVRVVATGRTSSGKSTLGNLLVGSDHFLKSDGHINCTTDINRIRFSTHLEYMDLPGVCSSDQLENYNRATLGLPQVEGWLRADALTVATYTTSPTAEQTTFPLAQFPRQQFRPDILLYLVAPHQKLLNSDVSYMIDLLHHYGGERIIFVLNLFSVPATGTPVTKPQDIEDARLMIRKAYQAAGLDPSSYKAVEVNCWTGHGLADLLRVLQTSVDAEKGRVFAEVIRYQQERTPARYVKEVQHALLAFFATIAQEKPQADLAKNPLVVRATAHHAFLSDVLGRALIISDSTRGGLNRLIDQITRGCERQITEPVIARRSHPVYYDEPVYETIEEKEPIYEKKPRYKKRKIYRDPADFDEFLTSFGNWFDTGNFGVGKWIEEPDGYDDVLVGYKTKKTKRYKGTRQKFSHNEYYQQVVGERVVATLYEPLAAHGIAFLATNGQAESGQDVRQTYNNTLSALYTASLPWAQASTQQIVQELKKHRRVLFDQQFLDHLKQVAQ